MRFQSFFMPMTVQPCCFASSYNAWGNVLFQVSFAVPGGFPIGAGVSSPPSP
jgi:hypothetical protein